MRSRIIEVANRLVALEGEIAHALQMPCPNKLQVMRLKMEKLRAEDELRAIRKMLSPYSWDRAPFDRPRPIQMRESVVIDA